MVFDAARAGLVTARAVLRFPCGRWREGFGIVGHQSRITPLG